MKDEEHERGSWQYNLTTLAFVLVGVLAATLVMTH